MLPDGESAWQKLQGLVYGRGIGGARIFAGLSSFLQRARAVADTILIISHKTEHGHFDPEKINLRNVALKWLKDEGFFDARGFGVAIENVFFESTRDEKLRRIATAGCNVFIDDLPEILTDPNFPAAVERILFSDKPAAAVSGSYKA